MSPLEPFKIGGFKGDFAVAPALFKACNADKVGLFAACLAANFTMTYVFVMLRLGIGRDNALEIPEDRLSGSLTDDVVGHDGGFAAAAGCVNNKGGDAVAAGVAAQTLDDFDTLAYGGAEMGQTHGKIANIDVVRTNADANEILNKLFHHMYAVVDACEQNTLVAEGNACVCKHLTCALALFGDFIGMVEMRVQPNGMVLFEHCAKLRGDPLRHDNRGSAAETDDFNMGHLAQLADDVFKLFVALHECVAAGKKNIANFGMIADIVETFLDLAIGNGGIMLPRKPAAGAVTAVHGALVGDKEQNPVRITMSQTGHGGIRVLMKGVKLVLGSLIKLCRGRNALTTNGIIGIVRVDEGEIIGSDRHAERAEAFRNALFLLGSQGDVFFEIFKSFDAICNLPMPIVPKLIGNIGEQTVLPAFIHFCLLAFRLSLRVFRGVNRISGDKKQSARSLSIKAISINSVLYGLSPAANLRSAESSPEKAYSQKTDL